MSDLWQHEDPIADLEGSDLDIPRWIESDISPSDVAAIVQGGCASGAYMPAVTYFDATQTMNEHGDDILQYIQDTLGELSKPKDDESWAGMACHYVSTAVELWASGAESILEDYFEELEDAEAAP